jgi:hypothetical protein
MVGHRYYNPEWGRWLSPDDIEYLDPHSINGLNLYAYCNNDPVNKYDPTGHFAISALIIGALIGAAFGFGTAAYVDYVDDGQIFNGSVSVGAYIGTTLLGGVVGGLGGAALTSSSAMLAGIAGGAAGGYVNSAYTQALNKEINLGAMYTQTIAGGIMGALGTKNLTDGVIIAKMLVSGTSVGLTSWFNGASPYEAIGDGIFSAALSCGISFLSYYTFGATPNLSSVDEVYAKQFAYRFVSFFKNII